MKDMFTCDLQCLSGGDQAFDLRDTRQQPLQLIGSFLDQLLEVIQHQQQGRFCFEGVLELIEELDVGGGSMSECTQQQIKETESVSYLCQGNEQSLLRNRSILFLVLLRACQELGDGFKCESGLADASCTSECNQS